MKVKNQRKEVRKMQKSNVNLDELAFSKDVSAQNWLKELLREQEVSVLFVKKDGTERTMLCTLSENKIPEEKTPKNSGRAQNSESLAVFDLEKSDWRSFRWDSIREIHFSS